MIKVCIIGNHPTVVYAAEELVSFLLRADRHLDIAILNCERYSPDDKNALWVGRDAAFSLPAVQNPVLDDAISVQVNNFRGIITGANERAVLIAVYRYLHSLGFDWVRPGEDGEVIPEKLEKEHSVSLSVVPTSRHRGVCIEGAVSFLHVKNMLTWIPRVGMNAYYTQFFIPFCFYDRWYAHRHSGPDYVPEHITEEDVVAMNDTLVGEVNKRSLLYHATGHGWTCEPFGVSATGWSTYDGEVPARFTKYMATIGGKKEMYMKIPLDTNLCYSNPEARSIIVDYIVDYCKVHSEVSYLHFWLADGENNHCECDVCVTKRPADWYVMMLNELDEKLTAEGLKNRIVFLMYKELLWNPETVKIKNHDRFVLMFAPITRTYFKPYADYDKNQEIVLPDFVRNNVQLPTSVGENLAWLDKWKEDFSGDSFVFDYHMMWSHAFDPGYAFTAKILHSDMCGLPALGLGGMISCQLQRVAFPTCLPNYAMAAGLFDKTRSFEEVSAEYYRFAFGEDGVWAENYLQNISESLLPAYVTPEGTPSRSVRASRVKETVLSSKDRIRAAYDKATGAQKQSWYYLLLHVEFVSRYCDFLAVFETGDAEKSKEAMASVIDYIKEIEREVESVLDVEYVTHTMRAFEYYNKKYL